MTNNAFKTIVTGQMTALLKKEKLKSPEVFRFDINDSGRSSVILDFGNVSRRKFHIAEYIDLLNQKGFDSSKDSDHSLIVDITNAKPLFFTSALTSIMRSHGLEGPKDYRFGLLDGKETAVLKYGEIELPETYLPYHERFLSRLGLSVTKHQKENKLEVDISDIDKVLGILEGPYKETWHYKSQQQTESTAQCLRA